MSKSVYLYVYDSLSDWECAHAMCGIRNPMFQRDPGRYAVITVAASLEPVQTAGGLRILPDTTIQEIRPQDAAMLMLPGGNGWEGTVHAPILQTARRFLAESLPVAAICGATLGLAQAGLLNAVRHTSNALGFLEGDNYTGHPLYQAEPAVRDGQVITASGLAPLAFARCVFECLDLYAPETLEAWYDLYTTQDPTHFYRLRTAVPGQETRRG